MPAAISILSPAEINIERWNACVAAAPNGLIYHKFEYLQHMCAQWTGFVAGDYESIMPLPWRKKWGIRYLYAPAFVQQLGWVGFTTAATDAIHQQFRYGDVFLNFSNTDIAATSQAVPKTNLVLNLATSYENISSRYKKDLQQNLKKAAKHALHYQASDDIAYAIQLYRSLYQDRFRHVSADDYNRFCRLCTRLQQKGECMVRTVTGNNNEIHSIGIFLTDKKRVYNMMNATTDAGRKLEANHVLIDGVIKEFAGQSLLFDFEGSDLPGIKSFYEKFGATDQPYFHYHFNHLPIPLRWLKR